MFQLPYYETNKPQEPGRLTFYSLCSLGVGAHLLESFKGGAHSCDVLVTLSSFCLLKKQRIYYIIVIIMAAI
jgi:hypothetical protein